ncbi:family 43 glycosylhydrolase [Marinimicrobium sp. ABcell2]|uniref:family 43 glycosylhydrolase n=1 Tax=Marinimicrobium sp. ABcell2 TaxID=3069751 RepID=UPI0027AEA0CB|nr:family 43 glycosylhydrolase [Marinimicrobium sp. ABcell2]MDQ2075132.1 family 43 glycosylhydrolase [Marinimicrobium sp. ABcell2]
MQPLLLNRSWFLKLLCFFSLAMSGLTASAIELTGITNSHDPSTLIREDDTYFHFTTGEGLWYSTSTNLTHWENPNTVFGDSWPNWINDAVPGFEGEFWAPDVIQIGNYYYLYYSVSTFGTSESAIGVVRTPSLKNPTWEDLGMVVQSYGGVNEINAIDPAVFRDHDGRVYMSYGSWFGGLGVAEVDQATGKLAGPVTHIYGGGHDSIEAPYITRNGDYYYLFFTRGTCCQGADSTYRVQVARSQSVFGPYTGERNLLPNEDGHRKGPGHIGVLKQDGCNYVSTHYYDLSDNGTAKLDIQMMTYLNGWPSMTHNFDTIVQCGGVTEGMYSFTSRHSGKALEVAYASTDNGANIVQYDYFGGLHQNWYVIDQGTGNYSLINAGSLKSMDVWEASTSAGANIAQWDYWGGAGQRWSLNPVGNYVEVQSDLSGHVLDVSGWSSENQANITQWHPTGGENQQWMMIRQ